jgi:hypothetical protein
MELKAWAKVELDPGQSKVVGFTLLAGDFHIFVGLGADPMSLFKASLRALPS